MKTLRETWLAFKSQHACSIDRMLCRPELRNAFLELARRETDSTDEEDILWAVMSLRKRKALSPTSRRHATRRRSPK